MRNLLLVLVFAAFAALLLYDNISRKDEPAQETQTRATVPVKSDATVDISEMSLSDVEMQPLATRAVTGDVRPVYLISGRIENSTGKILGSVTIRVFIQSTGSPVKGSPHYNKDFESYDEADIHVDGPIHDGTRGFSQQIQILPPRGKPWAFVADVVDAKVDTNQD